MSSGVIVTQVETKATTYTVKDQHSKKMIGTLKQNISLNEFSLNTLADAVITQQQMQEILNHMSIINKK